MKELTQRVDNLIAQVQGLGIDHPISQRQKLTLLRDLLLLKKKLIIPIITEPTPALTIGNISSMQSQIIRLLNSNGKMSGDELCRSLNSISRRTLQRHIQPLIESGMVTKAQMGKMSYFQTYTKMPIK